MNDKSPDAQIQAFPPPQPLHRRSHPTPPPPPPHTYIADCKAPASPRRSAPGSPRRSQMTLDPLEPKSPGGGLGEGPFGRRGRGAGRRGGGPGRVQKVFGAKRRRRQRGQRRQGTVFCGAAAALLAPVLFFFMW